MNKHLRKKKKINSHLDFAVGLWGWWISGAELACRGCCCVCRLHIVSSGTLFHILSAEAVKDPFKMLCAWFTIILSNLFYGNFFFFFLILLTYTAAVSSRRSTKPAEDFKSLCQSVNLKWFLLVSEPLARRNAAVAPTKSHSVQTELSIWGCGNQFPGTSFCWVFSSVHITRTSISTVLLNHVCSSTCFVVGYMPLKTKHNTAEQKANCFIFLNQWETKKVHTNNHEAWKSVHQQCQPVSVFGRWIGGMLVATKYLSLTPISWHSRTDFITLGALALVFPVMRTGHAYWDQHSQQQTLLNNQDECVCVVTLCEIHPAQLAH